MIWNILWYGYGDGGTRELGKGSVISNEREKYATEWLALKGCDLVRGGRGDLVRGIDL